MKIKPSYLDEQINELHDRVDSLGFALKSVCRILASRDDDIHNDLMKWTSFNANRIDENFPDMKHLNEFLDVILKDLFELHKQKQKDN
ncbi:hypothetical protein JZN10_000873 [Salmonella enterica]|nr:hypothetical protein [Salmonella enterica subsp. enterica serovar Oranienburg]EHB1586938.1 hypothetical protein [Salmonella enterica]EHC9332600.1 hypothetical protein [Salmonella enterica]ELG4931741.1 hypothetical protein [Salmonella enterica]